jgi:hypothetical protein
MIYIRRSNFRGVQLGSLEYKPRFPPARQYRERSARHPHYRKHRVEALESTPVVHGREDITIRRCWELVKASSSLLPGTRPRGQGRSYRRTGPLARWALPRWAVDR